MKYFVADEPLVFTHSKYIQGATCQLIKMDVVDSRRQSSSLSAYTPK